MHWRQMRSDDLDAVLAIADEVHPLFPETRAIFADKLHRHADGALVLESGGRTVGYCLAHPWQCSAPPPLNTLLDTIPTSADALYLHDLALLPAAHGAGAGAAAIAILLAKAALLHLERVCLVAVNGSIPFWARHGFAVTDAAALQARLSSYGSDARFMARAV